MTDNVIPFSGVTNLDIDPDTVLEGHVGELEKVVVMGVDKNGSEILASSVADKREILWMLERMKMVLLMGDEFEE